MLSSNRGKDKGENQMKVTCGFSESEEFCPFERERLEGKNRAFLFPHSMNA